MKTNYQIILKVLGEGGIRYWHPKEIEVIERVLTFQRKEILKMIEELFYFIAIRKSTDNHNICACGFCEVEDKLVELKKQISDGEEK